MKRQGTSKFVRDLVTEWLKQITSPAILDEFDELIKERRAMLMIETDNEKHENIFSGLKNCKSGDKLYVVKPLPIKQRQENSLTVSIYSEIENRMKCNFYQYKPRKKCLWVTVPWNTKRKKYGYNFIYLTAHDIKMFQPSRTELSVRLRNEQRRSG